MLRFVPELCLAMVKSFSGKKSNIKPTLIKKTLIVICTFSPELKVKIAEKIVDILLVCVGV